MNTRAPGGQHWAAVSGHQPVFKLVTARAPSGGLVGVAPFFRLTDGMGPTLHLLGSFEVSDYLDLLVTPDEAPAFVSGLVDFLAEEPKAAGASSTSTICQAHRQSVPLMLDVGGSPRLEGGSRSPCKPCPVISLPHGLGWVSAVAGQETAT